MTQLSQIFNQRDPRWGGNQLGSVSGATIAAYGCYLCVFADMACYYGHSTTPSDLNNVFSQKGYYVSGDLLTDNALARVYNDIQFVQSYDFSNKPADLNLLKQLVSDNNQAVALEIDFDHNPNDGLQTHFILCLGYDTDFIIADPWDGKQKHFAESYGTDPATTVQKFVIYKGPTAVSQNNDNLVWNSTQYDATTSYLGLPKQPDGKDVEFSQVKAKIDNFSQSINDLSRSNSTLSNQVLQDKTTIDILTGQVNQLTIDKQKSDDNLTAAQNTINDLNALKDTWAVKEVDYQNQISQLKNQPQQPTSPTTQPQGWFAKLVAAFLKH